jgi:hypothetical protein
MARTAGGAGHFPSRHFSAFLHRHERSPRWIIFIHCHIPAMPLKARAFGFNHRGCFFSAHPTPGISRMSSAIAAHFGRNVTMLIFPDFVGEIFDAAAN